MDLLLDLDDELLASLQRRAKFNRTSVEELVRSALMAAINLNQAGPADANAVRSCEYLDLRTRP